MANTYRDWLTEAQDLLERTYPKLSGLQVQLLRSHLVELASDAQHEAATVEDSVSPAYALRLLQDQVGDDGAGDMVQHFAHGLEMQYQAERSCYSELDS